MTERGLVDNAIYVDGKRSGTPGSLEETFELQRERAGMAWIGLYRPGANQINAVAAEFGLHRLVVDDAIAAHQRPKLERYDDILFTVLRPARYVDDAERVDFGELHVISGPDFVVTIRHAESPDLATVRGRLEDNPQLLRLGPEAVLYSILDQVVDEYAPVVAGLDNDIDEIEDQLFTGDTAVSRRIYSLTRAVIDVQRATKPLLPMVDALAGDLEKAGADVELRRNLRDVHDHVLRVIEQLDAARSVLQNALQVNSSVVGQQQNEEMKRMTEAGLKQNEQVQRISAWAAILFVPTLVGTIYGMNFDNMPELHWSWGYPAALVAMVALGVLPYVLFKRRGWL